jgi:glycine cleavage system transcriptional repressor
VNEVVVTAVGEDRPGIVAALTGALLEVGGNLADVRAALLRGSFATMLAVTVPEGVGAAEVERVLTPVAERLGMGLYVASASPAHTGPARARAVLSVYGADRPGIVHGIASALAEHRVNILDLSARLVGEPPIYVLGIEVELPEALGTGALHDRLLPVAAAHGVELTLDDEGDEIL